ncbi:L-sorbosone dehydrogenase [Ceratobasidium sp. AG-Ba]|nr:L-sorbosone dehydrogenase [Ceratobasidium sp. AG-Ba]
MTLLATALVLWAASTLAASPPPPPSPPTPSPGLCQPLASLSFAHAPTTLPGLKAQLIYNNVSEPRGIRFDNRQNLLVVERYIGVSSLTFRNDSGCIGWEKRAVVRNETLEHGIEIGPGEGPFQYLYASSMEYVFRWKYNPATTSVVGAPVTIAWNMSNVGAIPPDHVTRTLLLEPPVNGKSTHLIVSRGSAGNVDDAAADPNNGSAQIRRFPLDKPIPAKGYAWQSGQLLSWGNRNGVGIALSKDNKNLWEIENGSDEVFWRGVDVHEDNPAEELNLIPIEGNEKIPIQRKFYGYPSCFTAWNSSAVPPNPTGPQFNFDTGAQFSIRNPPTTPTDAWCADPKNNVPPKLSLQSHTAPLDLVFYQGPKVYSKLGINTKWAGDAFASLHGSWNRDPPSGYAVIRIPFKKDGSGPVAPSNSKTGYEKLVWMPDTTRCPDECIRPVGVAFDQASRMFVTSDDSNEILIVESAGA